MVAFVFWELVLKRVYATFLIFVCRYEFLLKYCDQRRGLGPQGVNDLPPTLWSVCAGLVGGVGLFLVLFASIKGCCTSEGRGSVKHSCFRKCVATLVVPCGRPSPCFCCSSSTLCCRSTNNGGRDQRKGRASTDMENVAP
eukprot:SAG31_NODE_4423_length_3247_cov_2.442503_4_plen_140_part_00